jgi:hypothetical protein
MTVEILFRQSQDRANPTQILYRVNTSAPQCHCGTHLLPLAQRLGITFAPVRSVETRLAFHRSYWRRWLDKPGLIRQAAVLKLTKPQTICFKAWIGWRSAATRPFSAHSVEDGFLQHHVWHCPRTVWLRVACPQPWLRRASTPAVGFERR